MADIKINKLLPQDPRVGPPLPKGMNIKWPQVKKEIGARKVIKDIGGMGKIKEFQKFVRDYALHHGYGLDPSKIPLHLRDSVWRDLLNKFYSEGRVIREAGTEIEKEIQQEVGLASQKSTDLSKLPMTEKGKLKPTREDVSVDSWVERDRIGIWIKDKRTDKTLIEWWDENARQMFEDGFFKKGMTKGGEIIGTQFVDSVLDYAESIGVLRKEERLSPSVKLVKRVHFPPTYKVRYETYTGYTGERIVKIPDYVFSRSGPGLEDYLKSWIKKNIMSSAKLLEYWKE